MFVEWGDLFVKLGVGFGGVLFDVDFVFFCEKYCEVGFVYYKLIKLRLVSLNYFDYFWDVVDYYFLGWDFECVVELYNCYFDELF